MLYCIHDQLLIVSTREDNHGHAMSLVEQIVKRVRSRTVRKIKIEEDHGGFLSGQSRQTCGQPVRARDFIASPLVTSDFR
jgi:hypothetical protein